MFLLAAAVPLGWVVSACVVEKTNTDATPACPTGSSSTVVPTPTDSAGGTSSGGPRSGLEGSNVTFSVHCCNAPPNDANLISPVGHAVVGPTIEFPRVSGAGNGVTVIDADVDIGPARIEIAYSSTNTASTGDFNGYVFEFTKPTDGTIAAIPPIVHAEVAADSAYKTGVTVTFDATHVFINASGLSLRANTKLAVTLTLGGG